MTPATVGHQCPECVAEGRRTQRGVRTAFGGSVAGAHGYATKVLLGINVVMLLLSTLSAKSASALAGGGMGGLLGGETPLLDKLGVIGQQTFVSRATGAIVSQVPYGVADGEYYRLFTAMFMHYGLIHLAVNMYALWLLGRPLEAMLGPARFTALYIVCGLGGSVGSYVFQPDALSAGASTAIFGLFGALFMLLHKLGRNASAVLPIIIINVIFTLTVPGISISGHFGGLATGFIVGAGIARAPRKYRTQVQTAVIAGSLIVLTGLTFWQTVRLSS
jgi:membrane associated rhomboid family serine protease